MNCEQIAPFLPGVASTELLGDETFAWIDAHLQSCTSCAAEAVRFNAVGEGLRALRDREPVPPAYLVDSILEGVRGEHKRRYLPVTPAVPAELVRVLSDNRDAIGTAAGVALAGVAAYALLRRARRNRTQLAT